MTFELGVIISVFLVVKLVQASVLNSIGVEREISEAYWIFLCLLSSIKGG